MFKKATHMKIVFKNYILIMSMLVSLTIQAQTNKYTEKYRPQFHFSPPQNWCNDPNGLVYNNGLYHLFYQHNPFGNQWGHMTWAHATSKDLVHWKHLPIAIPEENGIMIFSGTCVVDKNNTSGFGKNGKIAMVAIYTGHIENVNQSQNIACSLDDGVTWTKYANNPVLDLGKKDFRDPKVFWQQNKNYWVMAVMMPVEHIVQFYSSANLKDWKHLSDFGPIGDTSGVWECPDLTQVPVEGNPNKKKWLLQMSQNTSMQYFVGAFDGVSFTNENTTKEILRPDYGPDYYAAITYNQLPTNYLPTAIGWANNWNYANDIPTTPWKSAMTIPRTLNVKKMNGQWILVQKPIAGLDELRKKNKLLADENIENNKTLFEAKRNQFELDLSITPSNKNTVSGVRIKVGKDAYFEIGYNNSKQLLYIDRSRASDNSFNDNFKKMSFYEKKISLKDNKVDLQIFVDHSIVEVFVNGGEAVFTCQIFPKKDNCDIEIFSKNSKSNFTNIRFYEMESSWK